MTTNHTPAPWQVGWIKHGTLGGDESKFPKIPTVTTDFHSSGKIENGSEAIICEMGPTTHNHAFSIGRVNFEHTITPQEAKANAVLIAAAPELLEALRGCVEFMDSIGIANDKPNTDAARRLKVARAAIRKAEGRKA